MAEFRQTVLDWLIGGARLRSAWRGILLAVAVGIVAGIGAIVFHTLSQMVAYFALGRMAGYVQEGPLGEAVLFEAPAATLMPVMLLVVPTLGGLLAGWLIYRFAPEAEGHGTDAAIESYHHKRGLMRPVVPVIKTLASAITLGTGGSGGREGPIAQIGAGFGSYLGYRLRLSIFERRTLLIAGLGAGIGAIFHAPLAGAIFAIEVLYRDPDFESEALIPAFIATTVAYCVFNFVISAVAAFGAYEFEGFGHLFNVSEGMRFRDPLLLLPLTGLVFVLAFAARLYVRSFYGVTALFQRLPIKPTFRPAIGGFLTGAVALVLYYGIGLIGGGSDARHDVLNVLSFGYGFLQKILSSADGSGLVISVLLTVALGKMLTTSLTIGSGGSGGVFGPSMVIGGALGAVVGLLFKQVMPEVVQRVDMFVILGMAGFFAAAAKTPVSTLIMVTELTASYELLLPAMWVCALAALISRGYSIYSEQVSTRLDSPAHRGDFVIDVLQGLTVRDALSATSQRFITVPLDKPLSEVVKLITGTHQSSFPVIDNEGRYYGLFGINDVRQFLYDSDLGQLALAHDLATPGDLTLKLDMDLGSAIERFASTRFPELPVVAPEDPDTIVGMLRRQDVIATYNARLMQMRTSSGPHAPRGPGGQTTGSGSEASHEPNAAEKTP